MMNKLKMITLASLVAFGALSLQSCKEDEDLPQEFIADDNTFKSFSGWVLEATNHGPDPFLGTSHLGNDSTVTRKIYFKNGQDPANSKYPVGTLIVKHSDNESGTVNEYTAMAKRGNDFNPTAGDWEWFLLNSDGSIAVDGNNNQLRGANLFNGACVECHAEASSTDYVFSK